MVKEKLSGWFGYFESEGHFAVAKNTFYHKEMQIEESKCPKTPSLKSHISRFWFNFQLY